MMDLESESENTSVYSDIDESIITTSKNLHKCKSTTNNISPPLFNGTDNVFNLNYVERELECQICLSPLESPVPLPCGSHSLCLSCMTSLFKHQKRHKDGFRTIFCPSCGSKSGIKKVKKVEHFQVNRELERVQKAYEKEKALWINEKLQLETQVNLMKDVEIKIKVPTNENVKKKTVKKGLTSDEEKELKLLLESFGQEKLKEAQILISNSLKASEKVSSAPTKKSSTRKLKEKSEDQDDSRSTTPSKNGSDRKRSSSQNKIWEFMDKSIKSKNNTTIKRGNTVSVNNLEKREYSLRSLKRTKTVQG